MLSLKAFPSPYDIEFSIEVLQEMDRKLLLKSQKEQEAEAKRKAK